MSLSLFLKFSFNCFYHFTHLMFELSLSNFGKSFNFLIFGLTCLYSMICFDELFCIVILLNCQLLSYTLSDTFTPITITSQNYFWTATKFHFTGVLTLQYLKIFFFLSEFIFIRACSWKYLRWSKNVVFIQNLSLSCSIKPCSLFFFYLLS